MRDPCLNMYIMGVHPVPHRIYLYRGHLSKPYVVHTGLSNDPEYNFKTLADAHNFMALRYAADNNINMTLDIPREIALMKLGD